MILRRKGQYDSPEYSAARRSLSQALRDYGTKYNDQRMEQPGIVKYLCDNAG